MAYSIRHYLTDSGRDPFQQWFDGLADRSGRKAITRRLNRAETGNFGDHAHCRGGVREMRIDMGPGYRVYFALSSQTEVLLLCGGDKHAQSRDIARACDFWKDFRRRASAEN